MGTTFMTFTLGWCFAVDLTWCRHTGPIPRTAGSMGLTIALKSQRSQVQRIYSFTGTAVTKDHRLAAVTELDGVPVLVARSLLARCRQVDSF